MSALGDTQQCPICKRWFEYASPRAACAVVHLDGECCHYGQMELRTPPGRPLPGSLITEADGGECSRLFAEWAQREGILARVTEDECADLARAFMMGFAYGVGTGAARGLGVA